MRYREKERETGEKKDEGNEVNDRGRRKERKWK